MYLNTYFIRKLETRIQTVPKYYMYLKWAEFLNQAQTKLSNSTGYQTLSYMIKQYLTISNLFKRQNNQGSKHRNHGEPKICFKTSG